jgi:hypothetical protein
MVAITLVFLNFLRWFRAILVERLKSVHYNRERPRDHFSPPARGSDKFLVSVCAGKLESSRVDSKE